MQKKIPTIIVLLVVICFTPFSVTGDYNIDIGDEFLYDVVKWNWDITLGPNSSVGQGFTIAGHHFDEGEDILVRFTSIEERGLINWTIEKDGFLYNYHCPWLSLYIHILFQYPQWWWLFDNIYPWNDILIDQGPTFDWFFPFYDNSIWSILESSFNESDYSTFISLPATYGDYAYLDRHFKINYVEKKDIVILEKSFTETGDFFENNMTYNYSEDYNFMFAINKELGLLYGLHLKYKTNGIYSNITRDIFFELLIELDNYNIPRFSLGVAQGLPGYIFYIVPLVMISIVTLRFLNRKKL